VIVSEIDHDRIKKEGVLRVIVGQKLRYLKSGNDKHVNDVSYFFSYVTLTITDGVTFVVINFFTLLKLI
jgi:hypothetical protein